MAHDDAEEAWREILEIEGEMAAEEAAHHGEPKTEPKPEAKTKVDGWPTTEKMIQDLRKVGLDVAKFRLPSRAWTLNEAEAELRKRGVTGEDFKLTKPAH